MKSLSAARLKQMAGELDLKLDDEDLTRLRPMVEDLLNVGERLRRKYQSPLPASERVRERGVNKAHPKGD